MRNAIISARFPPLDKHKLDIIKKEIFKQRIFNVHALNEHHQIQNTD